ncbi:MAG: hypothetical protein AMXMBFR58_31810 [Phycisphaerae bacterium]
MLAEYAIVRAERKIARTAANTIRTLVRMCTFDSSYLVEPVLPCRSIPTEPRAAVAFRAAGSNLFPAKQFGRGLHPKGGYAPIRVRTSHEGYRSERYAARTAV